jgi:transcriptional regulator with XRE-family HTH domain
MGNTVPHPALAAELARAGVEQKDIAEVLGYHPSMITKRMKGDIEWRLSELQAIAAHLKVPVAALIDDDPAASPVAEPAAS